VEQPWIMVLDENTTVNNIGVGYIDLSYHKNKSMVPIFRPSYRPITCNT